jgi:hypothetical protein
VEALHDCNEDSRVGRSVHSGDDLAVSLGPRQCVRHRCFEFGECIAHDGSHGGIDVRQLRGRVAQEAAARLLLCGGFGNPVHHLAQSRENGAGFLERESECALASGVVLEGSDEEGVLVAERGVKAAGQDAGAGTEPLHRRPAVAVLPELLGRGIDGVVFREGSGSSGAGHTEHRITS